MLNLELKNLIIKILKITAIDMQMRIKRLQNLMKKFKIT
jgi:hypothetical protein